MRISRERQACVIDGMEALTGAPGKEAWLAFNEALRATEPHGPARSALTRAFSIEWGAALDAAALDCWNRL